MNKKRTAKQSFKERLATLMKGERPYRWARKVGIEKGLFQYYWQKGNVPTFENLLKIQKFTGCSLDWLLTGRLTGLDGKIENLKFSQSDGDADIAQRRLIDSIKNLQKIFKGRPADETKTIENILKRYAGEI